jgi:UDP-N-acetylmuramoylalanine--D-glutamate ligase
MEKLTTNIYNDAKSTNQYSTIAAISALDNVLLICGGYDRQDKLMLPPNILCKLKGVFAYGNSKDKIKLYMDEKNINCMIFNNLEEAFNTASLLLNKNNNLLYSPMFASYDQYKSYNERGHEFELLVSKLLHVKK